MLSASALSAKHAHASPSFLFLFGQGPYVVTMKAADTSGKELLCLEIDFDVTPPFFPPAAKASGALKKAKALLRGTA